MRVGRGRGGDVERELDVRRRAQQLDGKLERAVAETIEGQTGMACAIKPPNDIYLATQKIAGVLVEMRVEANGMYAAIAGIGLNVNHVDEDFPPELRESAGSLALATGQRLDRNSLAIALLRNVNSRYAALLS